MQRGPSEEVIKRAERRFADLNARLNREQRTAVANLAVHRAPEAAAARPAHTGPARADQRPGRDCERSGRPAGGLALEGLLQLCDLGLQLQVHPGRQLELGALGRGIELALGLAQPTPPVSKIHGRNVGAGARSVESGRRAQSALAVDLLDPMLSSASNACRLSSSDH